MNYYRRFPADYANDTRHLNYTQHGAYTLLLDYCYSTERLLPKSHQEIYRRMCAKSDEERSAIDLVLSEFFHLSRHGYEHKRVKTELARARDISAIASVNGRKGARIRLAKAERNLSQGLASQTLDSRLQILEPEKPNTKPTPRFACPDWIRADAWDAFEEMRKKIKAPMTDRARAGIVRELEKLRAGNDPNEVLMQSVTRSWRGVFPLNGNRKETREEFNARFDRIAAKYAQ